MRLSLQDRTKGFECSEIVTDVDGGLVTPGTEEPIKEDTRRVVMSGSTTLRCLICPALPDGTSALSEPCLLLELQGLLTTPVPERPLASAVQCLEVGASEALDLLRERGLFKVDA